MDVVRRICVGVCVILKSPSFSTRRSTTSLGLLKSSRYFYVEFGCEFRSTEIRTMSASDWRRSWAVLPSNGTGCLWLPLLETIILLSLQVCFQLQSSEFHGFCEEVGVVKRVHTL